MKKLSAFDNIKTPESWKQKALDTASFGKPKLKKKYEYAAAALTASVVIAFVGLNAFGRGGDIEDDDIFETTAVTETESSNEISAAAQFVDPTNSRMTADTPEELTRKVMEHSDGFNYRKYDFVDNGIIVKIEQDDKREDSKIIYLLRKDYAYAYKSTTSKEVYSIHKYRINSETLCYPWKGEKNPGTYKKVQIHPEGETPYEVTLGNVDEFQFNVGDAVQIYASSSGGYGEMYLSTALKCFELNETIANSGEYISKDTKDAIEAAKALDRTGKISAFEQAIWCYACNIDVKRPEIELSDETFKDMRVKYINTLPAGNGEYMYSVFHVRPDSDIDVSGLYTYNEVYAKNTSDSAVDIMVRDKKICSVSAKADNEMSNSDDPDACEHSTNFIDQMYASPDPDDESAFYVIIGSCSGGVEYKDNIDYIVLRKSDIEYMRETFANQVSSDIDPDTYDPTQFYQVITTDGSVEFFDPTVPNIVVTYSDWKKAEDEGRDTYKDSMLIIAEPQEIKELFDQKGIEYDTDFNDEEIASVQLQTSELKKAYHMKDKSEAFGAITKKIHVDISFDE